MEVSILKTTKKLLGLAEDYEAFDTDIIVFINSSLSHLNQLGVGPSSGFEIEDDSATWSDFFGSDSDPRLNNVKTFVYIQVRQVFDPPVATNHANALDATLKELEWRISVNREDEEWQPAIPNSHSET